MINFKEKEHYLFEDLLSLVSFLRAPDGCPWDRVQDHHSIRRCFLEETYEACEAIDQEDSPHLQEELGDVLYQVLFHADLEREAGRFTIDDVIDGICKKLVARHPALFSGGQAPSPEQALQSWEDRKRQLAGNPTLTAQMQGVCRALPGLWRAEKLQKKAHQAGFGCPDSGDALKQVSQETSQLQAAVASGEDPTAALGRLLFSAAAAGQLLGIDPEQALHAACDSFIRQVSQQESASSQTPDQA